MGRPVFEAGGLETERIFALLLVLAEPKSKNAFGALFIADSRSFSVVPNKRHRAVSSRAGGGLRKKKAREVTGWHRPWTHCSCIASTDTAPSPDSPSMVRELYANLRFFEQAGQFPKSEVCRQKAVPTDVSALETNALASAHSPRSAVGIAPRCGHFPGWTADPVETSGAST